MDKLVITGKKNEANFLEEVAALKKLEGYLKKKALKV